MVTWRELEADFTALAASLGLPTGWLEKRWTDTEDPVWALEGDVNHIAEQRFRALAVIGGKLLTGLEQPLVADDVAQEADAETRWYLALWHFGRTRPGVHGTFRKDGAEINHIYSTRLETPATVSAALCLHLAAQTLEVQAPLERQLAAPRYTAVQQHWANAHAALAGQKRDPPNGAKEAVHAVEALAQIVTADGDATLGDAIKTLRSEGRVTAPLLKGLDELWGFTSESPGVRHGSTELPNMTEPECQYVFGLAQAALHLLLSLDRTGGGTQRTK